MVLINPYGTKNLNVLMKIKTFPSTKISVVYVESLSVKYVVVYPSQKAMMLSIVTQKFVRAMLEFSSWIPTTQVLSTCFLTWNAIRKIEAFTNHDKKVSKRRIFQKIHLLLNKQVLLLEFLCNSFRIVSLMMLIF